VATASALALQAEKLICIIDGEICDENNRLIRFMTLQDADMLIRKRAEQSPTAATYVNKSSTASSGTSNLYNRVRAYNARFQNGVGFDNGNGLWTGGLQGFAIGGEERQSRLNGYFSELTAAAFVCQVSHGYRAFLHSYFVFTYNYTNV
jgi:amino-acid N-acetyltransferase